MAGLAALSVPTRTLSVAGQEVVLRGLSFEEIGSLMIGNEDAFDRLEAAIRAEGGQTGVVELLQLMPRVLEQAIAMAADEPDQADKVRQLGAGFLQEAALAVWELTTEPAGGGKKFIARLVSLFGAARTNLPGASAAAPAPH